MFVRVYKNCPVENYSKPVENLWKTIRYTPQGSLYTGENCSLFIALRHKTSLYIRVRYSSSLYITVHYSTSLYTHYKHMLVNTHSIWLSYTISICSSYGITNKTVLWFVPTPTLFDIRIKQCYTIRCTQFCVLTCSLPVLYFTSTSSFIPTPHYYELRIKQYCL